MIPVNILFSLVALLPRVSKGWLRSYLLKKNTIAITRSPRMTGATEKIIIQIASRLNVNLSSFIFLFLWLLS
jgi:hypothetical protein